MSNELDDDKIEILPPPRLREIIHDHPIAAIVVAFVIGLLIAKLSF